MPFNPNRPYGEVHNAPGVAYDQDGRLYDVNGVRVNLRGEPIADEPAPKQAPSKVKPAPKAKPGKVNVAGFDVPKEMLDDAEDTVVDLGDVKVNLSAWARGEDKVHFFRLKAAVEKEFGVKVANGAEVREVLIREGIIEPEAEAA